MHQRPADLVAVSALIAAGAGIYLWTFPPGGESTRVGVRFEL